MDNGNCDLGRCDLCWFHDNRENHCRLLERIGFTSLLLIPIFGYLGCIEGVASFAMAAFIIWGLDSLVDHIENEIKNDAAQEVNDLLKGV